MGILQVDSRGRGWYPVIAMQNVHREILRLYCAGVPVWDISVVTGVPVAAVENILCSPLARAEIARAR